MPARSSTTSSSRARIAILVIVAALCVVPALVRATFSGSTKTPIRLNRGFERPPAKASLTPPLIAIVGPVARGEDGPPRLDRRPLAVDDAPPDSPQDYPPDALRGPPAVQHV